MRSFSMFNSFPALPESMDYFEKNLALIALEDYPSKRFQIYNNKNKNTVGNLIYHQLYLSENV